MTVKKGKKKSQEESEQEEGGGVLWEVRRGEEVGREGKVEGRRESWEKNQLKVEEEEGKTRRR